MTKTLERTYEAIAIIHPECAEKDLARLEKQFEETITRLGGRVTGTSNLGKRRLSYKIKRLSEASALQIRFEAPPEAVAQFIKAARLFESVARIMVVHGEPAPAEAPKAPSDSFGQAREDNNGQSE